MIYFINGSPRTNGNTAALLDKAMEGAKAAGAFLWTVAPRSRWERESRKDPA
ncbi:hypothetical protein [Synergistes jonesii]|uniref:hypothetical protein n=1 Tax=Synergistes jonesii TaxID=2754 RepID=UPI00248F27BB|nr:hypothetical protein [Synergistes jonesii]